MLCSGFYGVGRTSTVEVRVDFAWKMLGSLGSMSSNVLLFSSPSAGVVALWVPSHDVSEPDYRLHDSCQER